MKKLFTLVVVVLMVVGAKGTDGNCGRTESRFEYDQYFEFR